MLRIKVNLGFHIFGPVFLNVLLMEKMLRVRNFGGRFVLNYPLAVPVWPHCTVGRGNDELIWRSWLEFRRVL